MLGKNAFYLLVRCYLTARDRRERLVDGLKLSQRGMMDATLPRLYFKRDLRKLILIFLGPMLDPR